MLAGRRFGLLFAVGAVLSPPTGPFAVSGHSSSGSATGCGEAPSPSAPPGATAARARPDHRHARPTLEAGTTGRDRALGAGLRDAACCACCGGRAAAPLLVLLAFCAGQVLTQVPITPGGLGFVEAGLTAMLAPRRGVDRRRRARHLRVPTLLLLASDARRFARRRPAPPLLYPRLGGGALGMSVGPPRQPRLAPSAALDGPGSGRRIMRNEKNRPAIVARRGTSKAT